MKRYLRKIYRIIPAELRFRVSSLWENLKNGRSYYSQNGEDVVLKQIFKNTKDGFYIDIGAHHPKKYSNTYLLYKDGWSGMNIDANYESIKQFKKQRPNDINLNIGVGDTSNVLTFYRFADPAVNTFSKEQANYWINHKKWNKYLGSVEIEVKNINTILNKKLTKHKKINLLSIDVEGLDEQIIKSLDFNIYKPEVIVIEDHNFNQACPEHSSIYNFLITKNYRLHCNLDFSLIFQLK